MLVGCFIHTQRPHHISPLHTTNNVTQPTAIFVIQPDFHSQWENAYWSYGPITLLRPNRPANHIGEELFTLVKCTAVQTFMCCVLSFYYWLSMMQKWIYVYFNCNETIWYCIADPLQCNKHIVMITKIQRDRAFIQWISRYWLLIYLKRSLNFNIWNWV